MQADDAPASEAQGRAPPDDAAADEAEGLLMPSRSKAQHRLMEAVANDPGFARHAGIPQSVGRDYAAADKAAGATRLPERQHAAAHHPTKLPVRR
jgi:hypothetical protein